MSPNGYAKQCGVCHAGGGQMEYDRDMGTYGSGSPSGDRYTYLLPSLNGGGDAVAGGIVDISATPAIQGTSLFGTNVVEVDCLLCHMQEVRPGAAWYVNTLACSGTNTVGPSDNPSCGTEKVVFMDMVSGGSMTMPDNRFTFAEGDFYDTYNRNIAISLGYFKQAASAGIGAGVDLTNGDVSNMPTSIAGAKIGAPKSVNCAACHARTQSDGIGLPGEAQMFGGMIAGFGNYVRLYEPGTTFDWDKINATTGNCTGDCANDTRWMEFGCKTGMGKRSQRSGYGNQDRWGNGFCLTCDSQNQWANAASFCALPTVQADCIAKSGIPTLVSDGSNMSLIDMTASGPTPTTIPGKQPDVDVHDASDKGMTCSSCHYTVAGTTTARTITGGGASFFYEAKTYEKMDHQMARGWSMLEQAGNETDGMVTCEGCHIAGENHHPNAATLDAPIAGHAGFPALHFDKIDCRTCHIPEVYSYPGRLLFRDWTAGAYRQGEGSNGNANHFDFAMNMLDGSYSTHKPMKYWLKTPGHSTPKIVPGLPSLLPTWTGSAIKASDSTVMFSPAKTRDITPAVAMVSAGTGSNLGIRMNGTNDHPPFNGFHLTDPFKIESKTKIDLVATELNTARSGVVASHARVRDARINLFPIFFDPSHGVTPKEFALGAPEKGGCVMCHSSSNPASPNYSDKSVGFFDSEKELLQNGMMQMANADCDNPAMFSAMTGTTVVTCIEYHPMFPATCNGYAPGTTSTGLQNGTMGMCKQQIGGMLAGQMGMTPDANMRMDGVEFMQMMAIREGGTAANCNPMMGIFLGMSHPMVTNCTNAAAQAANGGSPLGYMYSRQEISQHFAKMLQQSKFTVDPAIDALTMPNAITGVVGDVPTTMNRVFGIVSIAQRDGSTKKFDIGATCYNPMDFTHNPAGFFTCDGSDAGAALGMNYVKTFIQANEMLGYTPAQLSNLMTLFDTDGTPDVPAYGSTAPIARFSYRVIDADTIQFDARPSVNAVSYAWTFAGGTPVSATTATVNVDFAAGSHVVGLTVTATGGATANTSKTISVATNTGAPAASFVTTYPNVTTGMTVTIDDNSNNAATVYVSWGDGSGANITPGSVVSHTYTVNGVYKVRVHATNAGGLSASAASNTFRVPFGTASISGLVTGPSPTLTPIDEVYVTVKNAAGVFAGGVYTSATVTGQYSLGMLSAGTYTVSATKYGYVFDDQSVTVLDVNVPNVNFAAHSAATLYDITGSIANAHEGLLVICHPAGSSVVIGAQYTNYAGAFSFMNLASGSYDIEVRTMSLGTMSQSLLSGITVTTGDHVISASTWTFTPNP